MVTHHFEHIPLRDGAFKEIQMAELDSEPKNSLVDKPNQRHEEHPNQEHQQHLPIDQQTLGSNNFTSG